MTCQIRELSEQIGPVVLINRDMLDLGEGNAGLRKAIRDRLRRKARPMLNAAEALFLCCRHKLAIAHERSSRITMERIEAENHHLFTPCMPQQFYRCDQVPLPTYLRDAKQQRRYDLGSQDESWPLVQTALAPLPQRLQFPATCLSLVARLFKLRPQYVQLFRIHALQKENAMLPSPERK